MKTANIMFFERPFPSANSIVIQDDQTFLVDTGFGSDVLQTEKLLSDAGILPKQLNSIINTHYHSDHVGEIIIFNSGMTYRLLHIFGRGN